ncbi:hypothetical protein [Loigolactobacillus bifermentans]|uniref:hypothetical protein n=1 Tax=Loigolactobacillus bifermentans TaxID=1607 RepID=UPI00070CF52B|nr:hypothetical protein [Loigolactobacillus bifermentans]QGG61109.1 hypothetical protein LB003_11900 [Loigolactobacillus bifermentans]
MGGHLSVTTEDLAFKPHILNVQTKYLFISRYDIASISKAKTFGIVSNGLSVHLNNGEEFKFVIAGKTKFLKAVEDTYLGG